MASRRRWRSLRIAWGLLPLVLGCASNSASEAACYAREAAYHLDRVRFECAERGYTVDECPTYQAIKSEYAERIKLCQ